MSWATRNTQLKELRKWARQTQAPEGRQLASFPGHKIPSGGRAFSAREKRALRCRKLRTIVAARK